jgi:hypothetical protein
LRPSRRTRLGAFEAATTRGAHTLSIAIKRERENGVVLFKLCRSRKRMRNSS